MVLLLDWIFMVDTKYSYIMGCINQLMSGGGPSCTEDTALFVDIKKHESTLGKIEGPVWYTIYHHLPVAKTAQHVPLINQPMGIWDIYDNNHTYSHHPRRTGLKSLGHLILAVQI